MFLNLIRKLLKFVENKNLALSIKYIIKRKNIVLMSEDLEKIYEYENEFLIRFPEVKEFTN